jgi:hypothetical protein
MPSWLWYMSPVVDETLCWLVPEHSVGASLHHPIFITVDRSQRTLALLLVLLRMAGRTNCGGRATFLSTAGVLLMLAALAMQRPVVAGPVAGSSPLRRGAALPMSASPTATLQRMRCIAHTHPVFDPARCSEGWDCKVYLPKSEKGPECRCCMG